MGGILCEHCTALCCRYIALPIDTPETRKDFDDIRWYLLHEGVHVFVEDGDWYITMQTNCRHLQPDYRCGIYQTRPQICRDYTTANCDYHSGDYGWEQHFSAPDHLDEYVRLHPPKEPRRKRRARSAQSANGRNGNGAATNGRYRNGAPTKGRTRRHAHSTLRARLGKRRVLHAPRRRAAIDYAAASVDVRGVPLPVLNLPAFGEPVTNGAARTGAPRGAAQ